MIYFNCIDFFQTWVFFKSAWDILCHSIFIKSPPLSKRKALKERSPTIIIVNYELNNSSMPFVIPLLKFMIFFFSNEKRNTLFGSKNRWFSNLTQQVNAFKRISKTLAFLKEKPKPHPTRKFICKAQMKRPRSLLVTLLQS